MVTYMRHWYHYNYLEIILNETQIKVGPVGPGYGCYAAVITRNDRTASM